MRAPFIFAYQIESWMFLTMIVNHKPMLAVRQKPQPPQQGFTFNSFVTATLQPPLTHGIHHAINP